MFVHNFERTLSEHYACKMGLSTKDTCYNKMRFFEWLKACVPLLKVVFLTLTEDVRQVMRWGKARTCHESGLWSYTRSPHWRWHHTAFLHFPSTIALITQLSPITHCTDYTAETLFISLGLPLSHRRVLFRYCWYLWAVSLCECPVDYLDCLYSSDRLLPAFWIFSLSAACADLCIVPGYVSALPSLILLLLIELCLSDLLLFNKAAPGSQRHWPIIIVPEIFRQILHILNVF